MSKSKEPGRLDHPFWKKLLEENEPMWWVPLRIDLSDAIITEDEIARAARPRPLRPSRESLHDRVREAVAAITFDGGNPKRPPTKRQHIDKTSYAYGLLWGAACALDCSLREVLERYSRDVEREK
jgi:hypothetical protein